MYWWWSGRSTMVGGKLMTMLKHWNVSIDGDNGYAMLACDVPDAKMNTLGAEVLTELKEAIEFVDQCEGVITKLFITSFKKDCFFAGADINEIRKIGDQYDAEDKARAGQDIFNYISNLDHYMTYAVINGVCLGGGLELALACDYRIAFDSEKVKLGLPEVQLGFIPGWGGTQRLPRTVGLEEACKMICGAKIIDAKKAYKIGLVDRVVQPFINPEEWAKLNMKPNRRKKSLKDKLLTGNPVGRKVLFKAARKDILKKTKGQYPAPLKALDVLEKTSSMKLDQGLIVEAEAFANLAVTDVSRNLVNLFFMNEKSKKVGKGTKKVDPQTVKNTAVLGAGVMGGGIAWLFSNGGCDVRVKDINDDAILHAFSTAKDYYGQLVKRRKMTKQEVRNKMLSIYGTTTFDGFEGTEILVEAIVENLDIKRAVLAEAEEHVSNDCIIATNTSSLRVDDMASALMIPRRFCAMHFFNPVNKMPLVEIVKGKKTSQATINTMVEFTRRMKKTPVVVKDCPGFLVNRILLPYLNEAAKLVEEGADFQRIDKLLTKFGMPMGPFRLVDEIGIDVGHKVAKILHDGYGERMEVSKLLTQIATQTDYLGRKNNKGFYLYDGKKQTMNKNMHDVISDWRFNNNHEVQTHTDQEIVDRCIFVMIAEAARCLEEKIVDSADSLDLAMIMGTGFPPAKGGLMRYADSLGLEYITASLMNYAIDDKPQYNPCDMILNKLNEGKKFYDN